MGSREKYLRVGLAIIFLHVVNEADGVTMRLSRDMEQTESQQSGNRMSGGQQSGGKQSGRQMSGDQYSGGDESELQNDVNKLQQLRGNIEELEQNIIQHITALSNIESSNNDNVQPRNNNNEYLRFIGPADQEALGPIPKLGRHALFGSGEFGNLGGMNYETTTERFAGACGNPRIIGQANTGRYKAYARLPNTGEYAGYGRLANNGGYSAFGNLPNAGGDTVYGRLPNDGGYNAYGRLPNAGFTMRYSRDIEQSGGQQSKDTLSELQNVISTLQKMQQNNEELGQKIIQQITALGNARNSNKGNVQSRKNAQRFLGPVDQDSLGIIPKPDRHTSFGLGAYGSLGGINYATRPGGFSGIPSAGENPEIIGQANTDRYNAYRILPNAGENTGYGRLHNAGGYYDHERSSNAPGFEGKVGIVRGSGISPGSRGFGVFGGMNYGSRRGEFPG